MTSFGWVDGIVIDHSTILRGAKKEDALNVAVKMKNEFNQAFVLFVWLIKIDDASYSFIVYTFTINVL